VFVGTHDIARDESLRQSLELDRIQGRTRLARAERYVAQFRAAALAPGVMPDVALTLLPGVVHDVAQAIEDAGLARLVTQPEPASSVAVSRTPYQPGFHDVPTPSCSIDERKNGPSQPAVSIARKSQAWIPLSLPVSTILRAHARIGSNLSSAAVSPKYNQTRWLRRQSRSR